MKSSISKDHANWLIGGIKSLNFVTLATIDDAQCHTYLRFRLSKNVNNLPVEIGVNLKTRRLNYILCWERVNVSFIFLFSSYYSLEFYLLQRIQFPRFKRKFISELSYTYCVALFCFFLLCYFCVNAQHFVMKTTNIHWQSVKDPCECLDALMIRRFIILIIIYIGCFYQRRKFQRAIPILSLSFFFSFFFFFFATALSPHMLLPLNTNYRFSFFGQMKIATILNSHHSNKNIYLLPHSFCTRTTKWEKKKKYI